MEITKVRIKSLYSSGALRARVSLVLDDELMMHGVKVIANGERLLVAMPSRRDETGGFSDIVHPISAQLRQKIDEAVLAAYAAECSE